MFGAHAKRLPLALVDPRLMEGKSANHPAQIREREEG